MSDRRQLSIKASQIEIMAIALILLISVLGLSALWRAGINARVFSDGPPRIYAIQNEAEAYTVLASSKVRGRVLIHFGKHMPTAPWSRESTAPIDSRNYLFAAAADNLIRRIYGVIPDKSWETTRAKLKKQKSVFRVGDNFITGWIDGTPIISTPLGQLPKVAEPVVLNFSSDYFADGDIVPRRLYAVLKQRDLKYDLVTITWPDHKVPHYQETTKKLNEFQDYLRQFN